jgi:BASS family bile acid:Na+ symporter
VQQAVLMAVLAVMIYSVALEVRPADFRYVARQPLAVGVGLVTQFLLLPGATLLATLVLDLPAPTEAALLLLAACPGGTLSNVLTGFGRGNLALSFSISAIGSLLALALTPISFALMIAANPETAAWARSIRLDPTALLGSLLLLLAAPLAAAMLTSRYAPRFAERARKPLARFAGIALAAFIIISVASQWKLFLIEVGRTLPLVIAQNGLGLLLGWLGALAARLPVADRRAVTIEGGMQNSGLALGIVVAYFGAELQMVAVASLWGIWCVITGVALAFAWRLQAQRP